MKTTVHQSNCLIKQILTQEPEHKIPHQDVTGKHHSDHMTCNWLTLTLGRCSGFMAYKLLGVVIRFPPLYWSGRSKCAGPSRAYRSDVRLHGASRSSGGVHPAGCGSRPQHGGPLRSLSAGVRRQCTAPANTEGQSGPGEESKPIHITWS